MPGYWITAIANAVLKLRPCISHIKNGLYGIQVEQIIIPYSILHVWVLQYQDVPSSYGVHSTCLWGRDTIATHLHLKMTPSMDVHGRGIMASYRYQYYNKKNNNKITADPSSEPLGPRSQVPFGLELTGTLRGKLFIIHLFKRAKTRQNWL